MDDRPYIEYVTRPGQRWDQVAFECYGDPYGGETVIAANPEVPITPTLKGGTRLRVPVLSTAAAGGTLSDDSLPPWKRSARG